MTHPSSSISPHQTDASERSGERRPMDGAASSMSRGKLIGGVIAAVVAAAAIGTFVWKSAHQPENPTTTIEPDVPRAEGSAIVFSKSFRERAGIKTMAVKRAPLTPVVKVVGAVTYDPEHVAAVGTRIRGLVRKLQHLEGDTVKEGEVLAEIESAQLGEAQASVAMISAQKKAAELNAKRERDLASRKLSTEREAEVAEAALAEYKAMLGAAQQKVTALGGGNHGPFGVYLLRAPIAGTVVERHIAAGQSVEDNLIAFRVANLDHLWIELDVFERNLGAIRKDDEVEVIALADPGQSIKGRVAYVGQTIDVETRSAAVRVEVDNAEHKLRPGQSVTARIHTSGPSRPALIIPGTAVTFVDGKPTVFVALAEDRVVPTEVKLGATDGAEQEILLGLEDGAEVVVEGVFALKSELFR